MNLLEVTCRHSWQTVFKRWTTLPTYVILNWCTTETVACFCFYPAGFTLYFLLSVTHSTVSVATACCCYCFHVSPPSFSRPVLYVIVTFVICYWLTLYFLHTSKYRIDQRGKGLGRRRRSRSRALCERTVLLYTNVLLTFLWSTFIMYSEKKKEIKCNR